MSKLPSKRNIIRVGVVAHICNLSTLEAEAEESLTTLGCTCEAETGEFLGLTGQLALQNWQAPASARDPDADTQVESS